MIKTPMMLMLRESDALDEKLLKRQVEDISDAGFDAVCLEFRESYYDEFDEHGQNAMRIIYNRAKELGLGFVKIMPHQNKRVFHEFPHLRKRIAKEYCINLGVEECIIDIDILDNVAANTVIAAFRIEENSAGEIIKADNVLDEVEWKIEQEKLHIKADINGKYLIYTEYVIDKLDYAHKDAEFMLKEFLRVYDSFELDGFALDEFGAGPRHKKCYLCNESFQSIFEEKYGYNFIDKLYLMDHIDKEGKFAKVRYDYYSFLEDVTYDYQVKAKKLFTGRYGEDIFIGFHHTWWGEGNSGDLWRGNIDYFRLADNLSGGFVDAQYDSERTMTSLTLLAESLAKYSTGQAFNMCWDRFCTPEKMEYFHRFLAVRNVNWVGHALMNGMSFKSRTCPGAFIQTLKDNQYWGDVNRCISREKKFSEFIGNAQGKAKIAILYIWESNAYFNNEYMHWHRVSLKALVDKLVLNNIPIDIVPSTETNLDNYEVIFALWPAMMPKTLWEALKKQAELGKKIYFIGSPAYVTTEGESILEEFEKMIGTHIEMSSPYVGGHEYSAWDFWFTDKVINPVKYIDADYKSEFVKGNIFYYGYELALTDMFYNVVHRDLAEYKILDSDRVISKVFYEDDIIILTMTSRWQREIEETIILEENEIQIKHGSLIGIKLINKKVVEIIAEPGTEVYVNGVLQSHTDLLGD